LIGKKPVKVRLVFAEAGTFHEVEVDVPAKAFDRHERLIDCLREDAEVLGRIHVDPARLCAAYRTDE